MRICLELVTSFLSDQEVPYSIPDSAMGFSIELFHGIYGLGLSVYQCPFNVFFSVLLGGDF